MNVSGKRDAGAVISPVEVEAVSLDQGGLSEEAAKFRGLAKGEEAATLYLDMTDLIEYVKSNTSLSGIQRVVANIINGIEGYSRLKADCRIIPVIPEYDNCRVFAVDAALVVTMVDALEVARADRTPLNKAIEAVYASRKLVEPKSGDTFAIAGAFWIYAHFDMVRQMRDRGVKFVVFIHDLIQISHPEYVHEAATLVFRRSLVDVLTLADAVLTNSEFVAEDVRDFMRKHTTFEVPVTAVPLATELKPTSSGHRALGEKVRDLIGEPYVLSVSTIEVRKNHMYMIRVWEQLIRKNVANIPLLVFVGKVGWDIEPFLKYLNESDHLGGRLHVIHGVTDYELSELYRHAMFTIFPSFIEGFGLPLGESLAYGKPCISSNRASMPEVGGKFARYINPEDVREGAAEVERLLADPGELQRWTAEIAAGYKPRTWFEFVTDFFNAATEVDKIDGGMNGVIEAGEIVGMGRDEIKRRDGLGKRLAYLAPARIRGWHAVEGWGCWASSRRATLRFPTVLPGASPITLYLMLTLPDGTKFDAVSIVAEVGGISTRFGRFKAAPKWVVLDGKTDANGVVEIILVSSGQFGRADARELYVGVQALAYCERRDVEARLSLIEKIALGGD